MSTKISRAIRNIKSKYIIGLVAATLVGGTTMGVVLATVPDSNGVIHACYNTVNTRIIDPSVGQQCRGNENPLSWSQGSSGGVTVATTSQHFVYTGSAADRQVVDAICPSGKSASGGGYSFVPDDSSQPSGVYVDTVRASGPIVSGSSSTGWEVDAIYGGDGTINVYALCAG